MVKDMVKFSVKGYGRILFKDNDPPKIILFYYFQCMEPIKLLWGQQTHYALFKKNINTNDF